MSGLVLALVLVVLLLALYAPDTLTSILIR
jgi:hypothetical protein